MGEYKPYGETFHSQWTLYDLWEEDITENGEVKTDYPLNSFFTGHETDTETGFIYMKARYYDPATAKFLSVDPPILDGSYIPQGDKQSAEDLPAGGVFNAINLNGYQYCGNNPIKYVDPTGKFIKIIYDCT